MLAPKAKLARSRTRPRKAMPRRLIIADWHRSFAAARTIDVTVASGRGHAHGGHGRPSHAQVGTHDLVPSWGNCSTVAAQRSRLVPLSPIRPSCRLPGF